MKKAIFVDGQSFLHMTRALGIGSVKFNQLMNVIRKEIGDCREVFGNPFYTINHAGFLTMKKPISYAGFKLFATRTGNGKDDKAIISRIEQLPEGTSEVSEIVIVAGDGDYIPALQKQAEQGKKVFVLATETPEFAGGGSMVSIQLKEDFNFVELATFKDRIMRHEWHSYAERESEGADSEKKAKPKRLVNMEVVLTLVGNAGIVGNFLADLGDIVAKYPGMRSHFNSELINPAPVELETEAVSVTSQSPTNS